MIILFGKHTKYDMKTLFATLLFAIIVQTNIYGQYTSVFGTSYTEWNYITLFCDAGIVESFVQNRDTLIENNLYKVVDDFGLLRESDDNSKLWFRALNDTEEILIMDMNLNKGDTFSFSSLDVIVDTIFVENNQKIIEFDLMPYHCGYYEKLRFEEGKGVNFGFRFALTGLKDEPWLLRCHTKDADELNFLESVFGSDCRRSLVSVYEEKNDGLMVYPNPTNKWLYLKSELNDSGNIEILDHTGFTMKKLNNFKSEFPLDVESWPNGIYFLRINGIKNQRWIKLFKF